MSACKFIGGFDFIDMESSLNNCMPAARPGAALSQMSTASLCRDQDQ
jgi:hypothetical protein